MTFTAEQAERLENLCREARKGEFGNEVTFGPILVEQTEAMDSGSGVRVAVVYDDEGGRLNEEKARAAMNTRLEHLPEMGAEHLIVFSLVREREFPAFLKTRANEMRGEELAGGR